MLPFSDIEERLGRVFRLVETTASGGEAENLSRKAPDGDRPFQELERCTVETMAQEACYSLFHFIRLFPRYTLYTPYEYLIRRRLFLGLQGMFFRNHSVTRAAATASLQPDAFSRAVRRCCGAPPRSLTPEALLFLPTPWDSLRLRTYQLLLTGSSPAPWESYLPGSSGISGTSIFSEESLFREQAEALTREYLGQRGIAPDRSISAEDLLREWCQDLFQNHGKNPPRHGTGQENQAYFKYLQRRLALADSSKICSNTDAGGPEGFSPAP
ncbi:hypothetical protein SAMN05920897_10931 [Alkalispirochaeta americana]|uniref:HTH araC/xylS-type domain-containing protein n=2 Tax=Alkalispirochaeta americana TaxID=159291 RepID=A0A1N6SWT8_9SPIO|nr:hypothetical protein SAMN05920897_10931 [Alkalispirochaeta americana]